MKHSTVYSATLIIGALGAVITMIFHPTGNDLLGQPDEIARRNEMITIATHSVALFSLPLLFFGFLGFSRHLGLNHSLVLAGIVSYGLALMAAMKAVVINGLVAPDITRQIITTDGTSREVLRMILMNNTLLNQAFDKILIVACSYAVLFWSVQIIKNGGFAKIIGAFGCVLSLISIFGILSGRVRMNVHGFGLLVFGRLFGQFWSQFTFCCLKILLQKINV